MTTDVWTEAKQRAQVRVACGRIAGAAAAILEAHRLGTAQGPHEQPWTPSYARDRRAHLRRVAAGLVPKRHRGTIRSQHHSHGECTIPARLSVDWVIVTDYMVSARAAIVEWFASLELEPHQRPSASSPTIDGCADPPLMIRFDHLAALTTSDGASRLKRAAISVRCHMEAPDPQVLDGHELKLLKQLADGTAIADLAAEMDHSQRSAYRVLASLWKKLGVRDRKEGVRKATEAGLLN